MSETAGSETASSTTDAESGQMPASTGSGNARDSTRAMTGHGQDNSETRQFTRASTSTPEPQKNQKQTLASSQVYTRPGSRPPLKVPSMPWNGQLDKRPASASPTVMRPAAQPQGSTVPTGTASQLVMPTRDNVRSQDRSMSENSKPATGPAFVSGSPTPAPRKMMALSRRPLRRSPVPASEIITKPAAPSRDVGRDEDEQALTERVDQDGGSRCVQATLEGAALLKRTGEHQRASTPEATSLPSIFGGLSLPGMS
jgi:hypothetical protein